MTDTEYKIAQTGETITIKQKTGGGYEVACWDKENENRWTKNFKQNEVHLALAEYNRWRL